MTRSSGCLCYSQELCAATFVRVKTVTASIRRCIYFLLPCVVVHFLELGLISINASSLGLTASAHVLLNQKRYFDLIDLFLLAIYNRIPSKIILETISATGSMFLSKKYHFQLNLSCHHISLWHKATIYTSGLELKYS